MKYQAFLDQREAHNDFQIVVFCKLCLVLKGMKGLHGKLFNTGTIILY